MLICVELWFFGAFGAKHLRYGLVLYRLAAVNTAIVLVAESMIRSAARAGALQSFGAKANVEARFAEPIRALVNDGAGGQTLWTIGQRNCSMTLGRYLFHFP